jgi:thiol:disulfide interchange protein DsbC
MLTKIFTALLLGAGLLWSGGAGAQRLDFDSLPLEHAIKTVRGTGARQLAVFSDPDCPYCLVLERDTLGKIDNVTIYTFLYPLPGHPDAARKSMLIWCAADRAQAWADWMQRRVLPAPRACVPPLTENFRLGRKLAVRATPTLILPQGELLLGAVDAETLELKLNPSP